MSKRRLLVVEDDTDIAAMLQLFFGGLGYEVDIAPRGSDALEKTRHTLPHLIVLDIMLPDIDGYEVCRILRTQIRTSHIPVIFLTQRDERSDKLHGLELGADDFVTKPFDLDELRLRVKNAIARSERESLTDPRTNLPSGKLIEEQLRRIIRLQGWALLDIRLNHFNEFREQYGFVAGDDVLRFTSMLIGEILDENGSPDDFIGHVGGENFLIITSQACAETIEKRLKARFEREVLIHYSFQDRQQGFIRVSGSDGQYTQSPLMTLAIGMVSPPEFGFTDIREITERAADARRSGKS